MTGRERVLKAIKCEEVDRIPWVPFVGSHGGFLINKSADEYLKSATLIAKGTQAAIEKYKPDGIPVTFDLQIEAEVLGCEVTWSKDNPPAVSKHPLANGVKLEDLAVPGSDQGRIKTVLEAAEILRRTNPDIALYATIAGPFTLALHLLGTDIFMKMFDEVDYIHQLLAFCKDVCKAMSKYYIDAGCDVVAVVDPMTSQIGPDQFREFVHEPAMKTFEYIRECGAAGSFFVCGHAQQNIKEMCGCKCDNVSIDENIPLDYVRDICVEQGISFGGNLQLTTVLLLGSPVDAQKNAISCMEVAGEKGFLLAPGCDLPYATPPENLESIIKVVESEYERDVVKAMASGQEQGNKLDLSYYGQAEKVVVDIITLDSEACAPCQYMVDAVRKAAAEFDELVEWREHKIKQKESIIFMTSLMVHNVPTICIDGKIAFVSRIPPKDELVGAIQKRINEKFRMRIKQKRGAMIILSDGSDECKATHERIQQAVTETGIEVDIEIVQDDKEINSYGVSVNQLPAVVICKYQLKSMKRTPETILIKEWLKEIQ